MNCPQCDRWEHQGVGLICGPCGHTHTLGPCLPPRGCTCGAAHYKLGWHPVECEYFKEQTKVPDLMSNQRAAIDIEHFRNFVIERSVTIMEATGSAIDAVPLSDLVAHYEHLSGHDFYKNRAAPSVGPDTDHPHTFTPSNTTIRRPDGSA